MKSKLKIIIPATVAVIAIIIAIVCIKFTSSETVDFDSLMSTAQKYLIEQNYEQAIAEFEKIIELDPKNADAYIGIAEAYEGKGDTNKAIEWLEKGYELTGDERIKAMLDRLTAPEETETVSETTEETTTVTQSVTETTTIDPNIVTVPDLVGLSMSEAISLCAEKNISYDVFMEINPDVPIGNVISQSIKAESEMNIHSMLEIVVSAADESTQYVLKKIIAPCYEMGSDTTYEFTYDGDNKLIECKKSEYDQNYARNKKLGELFYSSTVTVSYGDDGKLILNYPMQNSDDDIRFGYSSEGIYEYKYDKRRRKLINETQYGIDSYDDNFEDTEYFKYIYDENNNPIERVIHNPDNTDWSTYYIYEKTDMTVDGETNRRNKSIINAIICQM